MLYDDSWRQLLLALCGLSFLAFAAWAAVHPDSLAGLLGYTLKTANSHSEFHAIYVGVFLAQTSLCVLAALRVQDAALGNLVGLFLLAQPLGRLLAWPRFGAPQGAKRMLFAAEALGGLLVLLVQPTASAALGSL